MSGEPAVAKAMAVAMQARKICVEIRNSVGLVCVNFF